MVFMLPFAMQFLDLETCVWFYVCTKINSKKSYEAANILSFLVQKNADVSIVVEIQGQLSQKNAQLPQFFFVNSNSPCKDVLFLAARSYLVQKPLYVYLVDTVLK